MRLWAYELRPGRAIICASDTGTTVTTCTLRVCYKGIINDSKLSVDRIKAGIKLRFESITT